MRPSAGKAERVFGQSSFQGGTWPEGMSIPVSVIEDRIGSRLTRPDLWSMSSLCHGRTLGSDRTLFFGVLPIVERIDLLGIALFLVMMPLGRDDWGARRPSA